MIELDEDLLETPSVRRRGGGSSRFRFSLTAERDGAYIQLEMSKDLLAAELQCNPDDPNFRLKVSFVSSENSLASGLSDARHLVVRASDSAGIKPKLRGRASFAIRVGHYPMTAIELAERRDLIDTELEPTKGLVGGSAALIFSLPGFAREP